MSTDYAGMTIKNSDGTTNASKGNAVAVQDMIGTTAVLRGASGQMQNGHIGTAQAAAAVTPATAAALIAANNTHAIKSDGSDIKWATASGTWVPGP